MHTQVALHWLQCPWQGWRWPGRVAVRLSKGCCYLPSHTPLSDRVCVDSGATTLHLSDPNSWADSELSAASQANAKTNLVIISGNPAHYRLLNYPINSTSWESLFATQANVCSQISRQEDSSIVQTQGFDNAERAGLVADRHREKQRSALLCTLTQTLRWSKRQEETSPHRCPSQTLSVIHTC